MYRELCVIIITGLLNSRAKKRQGRPPWITFFAIIIKERLFGVTKDNCYSRGRNKLIVGGNKLIVILMAGTSSQRQSGRYSHGGDKQSTVSQVVTLTAGKSSQRSVRLLLSWWEQAVNDQSGCYSHGGSKQLTAVNGSQRQSGCDTGTKNRTPGRNSHNHYEY